MLNRNIKTDAVILAGGKGTRIKKFLQNKQKCVASFNNKTFLDYILRYLSKFDINKIYILTGHKSKEIFKKFNNKKINFIEISCIREAKPLGTGGALNKLKQLGVNDFFLLNGDSIIDLNINKLRDNINKDSIGIFSLIKNKNYNNNHKLNNLDLKKKKLVFSNKNSLMNAGVYFFKKRILKFIFNKKMSLEVDIIPKLINRKLLDGIKFDNKSFNFIENIIHVNKIRSKKFLLTRLR